MHVGVGHNLTDGLDKVYSEDNSVGSVNNIDNGRCDVDSEVCDVVIVLAPSAEMSAQVNGVDAGRSWPLVSSPQLNLYAYDVELQTWRCVDRLPDFPVPGAMLEKHAWRIAWHQNHLYLFRLLFS